MQKVRAKKHLGQHFLKDTDIAANIVGLLSGHHGYDQVLEVGPGMGVLTDFLLANSTYRTWLVDIDRESIAFLHKKYPTLEEDRLIQGDFLHMPLDELFPARFALIGNFPYNISSQILFKVLAHKNQIPEVVCMLQKEVAQRIASPPGNRDYGILSVFLQAYYDIEYAFTVPSHVFDPPPKVQSGVIRLKRNGVQSLKCDEKLFFRLVKQGFNNRRKTLRNALKPLGPTEEMDQNPLLDKRAEQLGVAEFVQLTRMMEKKVTG